MSETAGSPVAPAPVALSPNARAVFDARWAQVLADGARESPEQAMQRVARAVAAAAEPGHAEALRVMNVEDVFFELLHSLDFLPNSPTWTGAGTKLGQLAACFVLPVKDSLAGPGGIMKTLMDASLIQQTGGGNGFDFSELRPKGARIRSTSEGVSSGPVSFMGEMYDGSFATIQQGGTRRGANMAVLRVDHPDIEEFIECKAVEGAITNFNISVALTDEFMRAVEEGATFTLHHDAAPEMTREVSARALMRKIAAAAHRNGEPGVLFVDTANLANPVPHEYTLRATNPCGT